MTLYNNDDIKPMNIYIIYIYIYMLDFCRIFFRSSPAASRMIRMIQPFELGALMP